MRLIIGVGRATTIIDIYIYYTFHNVIYESRSVAYVRRVSQCIYISTLTLARDGLQSTVVSKIGNKNRLGDGFRTYPASFTVRTCVLTAHDVLVVIKKYGKSV